MLLLVELAGPFIAERRRGGTPWHAHHIAERYGLLIIIALGEGIIGTIASLGRVVGPEGPGWTRRRGLVALAGVGLTFGMWWATSWSRGPSSCTRAASARSAGATATCRSFAAIVAMGGGLHVAAYYIEHHSELDAAGTILTVAIPVAVAIAGVYGLYTYLTSTIDGFHWLLIAGSAVVLVLSYGLASAGLELHWALLILAMTPWVTVVGFEARGHEHTARVLQRIQ